MKNRIAIVLVLMFSFPCAAFAEVTLKAEVDKTSVTTDETLTYKLSVTSSQRQLPLPSAPKFEGFRVLSSEQASEISIGRGNLKTMAVYIFILYPDKTGKLKIEPSQIKIKGKPYLSESFEIEVKQGKVKPKPGSKEKSSPPKNNLSESGFPKITL